MYAMTYACIYRTHSPVWGLYRPNSCIQHHVGPAYDKEQPLTRTLWSGSGNNAGQQTYNYTLSVMAINWPITMQRTKWTQDFNWRITINGLGCRTARRRAEWVTDKLRGKVCWQSLQSTYTWASRYIAGSLQQSFCVSRCLRSTCQHRFISHAQRPREINIGIM